MASLLCTIFILPLMPQKIEGTKVPKDIELKVGISLCLVGAICLILSGIMMVVSPNATEQLNAAL